MSVQGIHQPLFDAAKLSEEKNRDETLRALDDLFLLARKYTTTRSFNNLLRFMRRFRFYSPFNAMLIHAQIPGAKFVAPADRWLHEYNHRIKTGSRPLVILRPKGPVMFVFDVSDTEPVEGAPPLPAEVVNPFGVRHGSVGHQWAMTCENAKRDGIAIIEHNAGSQRAGSIQTASGGHLNFLKKRRPREEYERVPLRYEMLLNNKLSRAAKYATLAHELGHLYCGHLGSPNVNWWPNRSTLNTNVCEFEAESVCYLVCSRMGIDNPSDEYLAGYIKANQETPPISLEAVMKAAGLIERMGSERLRPRKRTEEI